MAMVLILAIVPLTMTLKAQASMNAGDAGWQQGKNDKLDQQTYNPKCPDGLTDAQCGFYRAGYAGGWAATSFIRPDDEPNREFNFDEDHGN